ncbi:hypothetical protein ILUMI_22781 [Ignelater luminosus]|uniref:Transposase Tc1-like domain-containing protein n=1 Tax=Ignelater luminosus TaxID=2038154 RepID=A0A8K0G2J9_IGNLU|nr:hypothetical protein ILUMI_22781 [Ignelater luminosus]
MDEASGMWARVLNVSHSTIQRVLNRFRETSRNIPKPGCGRKRKITTNDDRFLVLNTLRNRHLTSVETRNQLREVGGTKTTICLRTFDLDFCLHSPNGRERVWRRKGERFSECTFSTQVSHEEGSVMVWAGISMEAYIELRY